MSMKVCKTRHSAYARVIAGDQRERGNPTVLLLKSIPAPARHNNSPPTILDRL